MKVTQPRRSEVQYDHNHSILYDDKYTVNTLKVADKKRFPSTDIAVALDLINTGRLVAAKRLLLRLVNESINSIYAWLLLGQILERDNDKANSLNAYFRAVTTAQINGLWLDESTTPSVFLKVVVHAITRVRKERADLLWQSLESARTLVGSSELHRVEKALSGYLKRELISPKSVNQRPRLFYFPDLPEGPYHDPNLCSWASFLRDSYQDIRGEALHSLSEKKSVESFLKLRPGAKMEDYLRGYGRAPAWDALFFYRHGKRYDINHKQNPITSKVLNGIQLCEIEGESPEICFSIMRPGTEILAHYGVTNVRLVMHLPLVIPSDCALNVDGGGLHAWREGELVLFDDTFRHEAWNRSSDTRIILLMDCWNPHLSVAEKLAVKCLLETISALGKANQAHQQT